MQQGQPQFVTAKPSHFIDVNGRSIAVLTQAAPEGGRTGLFWMPGFKSDMTGGKAEAHYAITRHVTIEGDLDADQKQRLTDIADRCPVSRTLTGQIVITTSEGSSP